MLAGAKDLFEKWATTVASSLSLAVLAAAFKLYLDVSSLQQYHGSEWPLEKQLMLIEHQQLRARIDVNEANIEELENEVKDLQ